MTMTDEAVKRVIAIAEEPDSDMPRYRFDQWQKVMFEALEGLESAVAAENARLRADAQAAVALVVERAADLCKVQAGLSKTNEYDLAWCRCAGHLEYEIRAIAPVDGLAMVEALRKERDDFATSEKELSGAYLRIRAKLNAWDTKFGGDDRFDVTEAALDRLAADLSDAQAQIEALRAVQTHGADTIATVLILDIAAALQGRDRVVLTTDETSLGPRILEFAAALAALPVPNFSAGWPLEENDGSIIVGATKPAKEGE